MRARVIRDDLLVDAVLFIRKPVEAVHGLLIFFIPRGVVLFSNLGHAIPIGFVGYIVKLVKFVLGRRAGNNGIIQRVFLNQHGQFSVLQKKALEVIGVAFFIYTQITVFCAIGLSFKSKISMIQFCRIPSVSPVMININHAGILSGDLADDCIRRIFWNMLIFSRFRGMTGAKKESENDRSNKRSIHLKGLISDRFAGL